MSKLILTRGASPMYPELFAKNGIKRYTFDQNVSEASGGAILYLGTLSAGDIDLIFDNMYRSGYSVPDAMDFIFSIHLQYDVLFFNYMRVVVDLVSGYDVEICIGSCDDISVSILEKILYSRYRIIGNTFEYICSTDNIPEVTINRMYLSEDLNRFDMLFSSGRDLSEVIYGIQIKQQPWYI